MTSLLAPIENTPYVGGTANSYITVDVNGLQVTLTGVDGELLTWDASGVPAVIAAGTSGQILVSNGAGAAPTFQTVGGTGDFMADGTVPMTADFDGDGNNISDIGVVFMREQAAADADVIAQGQLWVKTATPNQLWFTDDAGTDFQLGVAGGGATTSAAGVTYPTTLTDDFAVGAVDNTAELFFDVGISQLYIGNGIENAAPADGTIQGTSARGGTDLNTPAADLIIAPGQSTGTGTPAHVALQGTTVLTTGTTAQTLTTFATVGQAGLRGVKAGGLAKVFIGDVDSGGTKFSGLWVGDPDTDVATPTITNYAFLKGTGNTIFNTPAAENIDFRVGNSSKFKIFADGSAVFNDATTTHQLQVGLADTPVVTSARIAAYSTVPTFIIARDTANNTEVAIGTISGGTACVVGAMTDHPLHLRSGNGAGGGNVTQVIVNAGTFTFQDAVNIVTNATTGTKIGTATSQKIGLWNATPVVQPTALTAQDTSITHTAPGSPDFAVQDLIDSGVGSAFGFATKDEGNTVLQVILNLQTRVQELEDKLQSIGALA